MNVNDEERDDKYDHGYIFMENAQEEEVLFNVLASFVILGAYNVEEEGIPLLKIYLENGKAAVLHKKYKKKTTNKSPYKTEKFFLSRFPNS